MIILSDYLQKVKSRILENKSDLYVAALIFLVSIASFGLGRLSVLWPEKEPITITNDKLLITNEVDKASVNSSPVINNSSLLAKGRYVASKNGTAYHFPWCAGALKIKEENKIWFQTKGEAEKAGYKPAGNCEGL